MSGAPRAAFAALAPEGDRRMGANPHANGGRLLHDPTFRFPRMPWRSNGRGGRRGIDAGPDSSARRDETQPSVRLMGRTRRLNRLMRCSRLPSRPTAETRQRRACRAGRPRGRSLRAHVRGLAGGVPADGPARILLLLRGVHPHRRLHVQPAREMAEGQPRDPRQSRRVLELPAHVPRRRQTTNSSHQDRFHRSRREQEGGRRSRLFPTRTRSCRSRITASAAATTLT